jgi:hypothetical protein
MSINSAIVELVDTIPSNHYFDSHFIIQLLIERNSDEYIRYVAQYTNSGETTKIAHSQIGKEIQKFCDQAIIEQMADKTWSLNIHHNPSDCTLYKKL